MADGTGERTLWYLIQEPQMLIALIIMVMFMGLVFMFGLGFLKMDVEAKQTILQAMIVAFTASWSYWLGSSSGSKMKDQQKLPPTPPVDTK